MTPVAIQPYEFNLLMVLQRQLTNLGMVHASTWDSLLPKIFSLLSGVGEETLVEAAAEGFRGLKGLKAGKRQARMT